MPILHLSLLRLPDFRWLGLATVVNAIGMMGEAVVLGWLTLELTNSPLWVGVAMGVRAAPFFFVGLPAGVLADRVPRHRVLIAASAGQALMTASIGILTVLGIVQFSHILLFTFGSGMMRGIDQASRQGYAHDVVGAARLMDGLAVLGVAMRTGWLLGSLGTGAVIAHLGSGAAYLAVAGSYLLGAIALLPTSAPAGAMTSSSGSVWKGVTVFVAALRRESVLPVLMVLTAGAEILGFSHQVLLPSLARDVLHVGPEGLGAMNAARSVGGILGLVAISARSPAHGGGMLFLAVLVFFGAGLIGLGFAPQALGLIGVLAVLVIANSAGALADLLAQGLMQLSVPPDLRGRAGGAWVVAIGLAPLGQLQIGALASVLGVSLALGASGGALVALAVASALLFPRVRRL